MWEKPIKVHVIKEEDTFTGRGGTLDRVLFDKKFWSMIGPFLLILIGFGLYSISGLLSIFMIGLGVFWIHKKIQKRRR